MLYRLLKIPVVLARLVWCPDLLVSQKESLQSKGPLLIAASHPNSFLDALLIACLFRAPVYSLARGDVFAHPLAGKLLSALNIFPVYRLREGSENLAHNYTTFDLCMEIFRKNGVVLIFSEGLSINEWKLRPLKKGTARLAIRAWNEGIPLTVLPTGINYNNFGRSGKIAHLLFGERITESAVRSKGNFGEKVITFNNVLRVKLGELVYEIPYGDKALRNKFFKVPASILQKAILLLPATLGLLAHFPFYQIVRLGVGWKLRRSDHFDSVLIGSLFLLYPFYLLGVTALIGAISGNCWSCLVVPVLPFLARCTVRLKNRMRH